MSFTNGLRIKSQILNMIFVVSMSINRFSNAKPFIHMQVYIANRHTLKLTRLLYLINLGLCGSVKIISFLILLFYPRK